MTLRTLSATLAVLLLALPLPAQERGQWRAASTTARGVTGDVAFSETRLSINFSSFTLAQLRELTPEEVKALFSDVTDAPGKGNLYRTDIPGDKRFLHKNTLCGAEDVQYIATFVSGKTLEVAMFSGAAMPKLTPEAIANTTSLCGTYGYTR